MALVPLTDELMADSSALQTEVPGLVADSIKWKVNEAILFGNGNGQPLGALLSSGPAVTQLKDSGQATNTLTVSNLFNMLSRLPNANAQTAIWLIHPTVIPLLATLVLGQIPVFLPGGMANVGSLGQIPVFGTLLGRPIILSHHAAAVSTAGDVQLLDLSYYRTITKSDGVTTATSLHLYFDADAAALRVTFRVDGSPKIATAISPAKGSTTLSPFIQLGAR
jgi:HK97 family phage major capsid protein